MLAQTGTENVLVNVGDKIGFRYNTRYVQITIDSVVGKFMIGRLLTDYIGKNEEWYAGELKSFSIKAMKKITKIGK
jgi:hypothetical protein